MKSVVQGRNHERAGYLRVTGHYTLPTAMGFKREPLYKEGREEREP